MIKISTRTRYGLRALVYLAGHTGDKPVPVNAIAEDQEISPKYLESVFKLLKNAGIVTSSRGPEGGYRLVKKPGQLTMHDVFSAIEGPFNLVDCISDKEICSRSGNCSTTDFYREMQDKIVSFLKNKTLAGIIK